jgi:DNA helicase-2/ATP-dependent DNA helicase PcrA
VEKLLEQLNESQALAVKHTDGPSLVIAGAGSGKTRVLTFKVAYLISKGVDPFNILALTFTNKAAREMKERIRVLLGNTEAMNVWMGTFHSIFARILRIEAEKIGYTPTFTIYDTDDSKSLLKNILKELQLDPKVYNPSYVLHRISMAKNNLISAYEYSINKEIVEQDKGSGRPFIADIFANYSHRCKKANAMDFDDILFNTNLLLRNSPEALFKYQKKFRYILVDEYQDTNFAQYLIIKKLAADNENICVVGDDAQSIYAFRGASIQNILNFKNDYSDYKLFKLEQNYRSTKHIVGAANSLIANNRDQIKKEIWTDNETGNKIKVLRATTDGEEGSLVANAIFETKMNHQLQNDAFAILYRTNAQSRSMEEALRKLNIPYRIYGGLSFYRRKEIKDMLAYFRLTVNPNDEEALFRIINYPVRGIGTTTLERIIATAATEKISPWELLENARAYGGILGSAAIQKLENFTVMIKSFKALVEKRSAYELARHITTTTGIIKALTEEDTPESINRVDNIEELLNAISDFCENSSSQLNLVDNQELNTEGIKTLNIFLQDIALITDAEEDNSDTNKVSLMTIHAAKGLEFPYVFVVGIEENLFPGAQSVSSRADLEEERRLFYVAMTRAEKHLTLSYAENRYRWGVLNYAEPSRFLSEIKPEFIEEAPQKRYKSKPAGELFSTPVATTQSKPPANPEKFKKINSATPPSGKIPENLDQIQAGMNVMHEKFGRGKVVAVEGSGANSKASVFFQGIGNKQLLLRFARLTILDN